MNENDSSLPVDHEVGSGVSEVSEIKGGKPEREINWSFVEGEYRSGVRSLRDIAAEAGITEGGIRKRAIRDGWTRGARPTKDHDRSVLVSPPDEMESCGFVYAIFIDTGLERLFKVGLSSSPIQRVLSHQTSLPFDARIAISYFVPSMRHEESVLHAEFADRAVRGEWFRLDDADLAFMASRARLI